MILARFRRALILGCALTLGVGLASWHSALAGVSEQGHAKDIPSLIGDARASGAIVVAENEGDHNGDNKKHRKGKNANRDKDDNNRHGDGGATRVIGTVGTTAIGTTTATGRSTAKRMTTTAMVTTVTGRVETTATGRSTATRGITTATETGARTATNIEAGTTKITVRAGAATTTIGTRTGTGVPMCEIEITSLIMASSSAASFSDRF